MDHNRPMKGPIQENRAPFHWFRNGAGRTSSQRKSRMTSPCINVVPGPGTKDLPNGYRSEVRCDSHFGLKSRCRSGSGSTSSRGTRGGTFSGGQVVRRRLGRHSRPVGRSGSCRAAGHGRHDRFRNHCPGRHPVGTLPVLLSRICQFGAVAGPAFASRPHPHQRRRLCGLLRSQSHDGAWRCKRFVQPDSKIWVHDYHFLTLAAGAA